ncbi:hypothetical protein BGZ60DRAFT_525468 [Tricladium varicosporioides]|nr:hypothetical protein BGZ60DRAFT_525468 [Hymenoscyphus varicosporioides]
MSSSLPETLKRALSVRSSPTSPRKEKENLPTISSFRRGKSQSQSTSTTTSPSISPTKGGASPPRRMSSLRRALSTRRSRQGSVVQEPGVVPTGYWLCCQNEDNFNPPCKKKNDLAVATCERCGHWNCESCTTVKDGEGAGGNVKGKSKAKKIVKEVLDEEGMKKTTLEQLTRA